MREGLWRLADPKISLASFAAMFLAAAAAGAQGPIPWGWLALTVLGVFAVEVAKNASGEVYDWDSGTDRRIRPEDRSPFSGGKRVLVDHLLTRDQTWGIAVAGYTLATLAGLAIIGWRDPRVAGFAFAGGLLAFTYHAPPLRLAYRGFGEAAVALAYGPLLVAGTWLVLRGTLPLTTVLLGMPLGLAIGAFLWINEFPDYDADRASGKRNLVVRLGRRRAAAGYALLQVAVYGSLLALPLAGVSFGVYGGPAGISPTSQIGRAHV